VAERLRVLFISAEVTPFARTGGLGDVNGALPPVLAAQGHDVRVVMPLYQTVRERGWPLTETVTDLQVPLVFGARGARVWQTPLGGQPRGENDIPLYFIEQDEYFARPGLYGTEAGDYPDNASRFIFFCRAALALAERLQWFPHIFHCHDWHTGLVPAYLRFLPGLDSRISTANSVFTIHNLAYHGWFPAWVFGISGLPLFLFQPGGVEFLGGVDFMKTGIVYADRITAVSPTYAEEICTPELGFGLDGVLRQRRDALVGILNGADYQAWNPETDSALKAPYNATDLSGKEACKTELLREYGLPEELSVPLLGMVSRLVDQKGVDLVVSALERLLTMNIRLVILGAGEPRYEQQLTAFAQRYPERLGVRLAFDEPLSHRIQAGSDCFLMPSRYEPCGLTQLYSLRYGTIPIVRATGGLRDTVQPFDPATGVGTGFVFTEPSAEALLEAVRAAVEVFDDKQNWRQLQRNAMAQDFSWDHSASQYVELYRQAAREKLGSAS
jgi:starch synthase